MKERFWKTHNINEKDIMNNNFDKDLIKSILDNWKDIWLNKKNLLMNIKLIQDVCIDLYKKDEVITYNDVWMISEYITEIVSPEVHEKLKDLWSSNVISKNFISDIIYDWYIWEIWKTKWS